LKQNPIKCNATSTPSHDYLGDIFATLDAGQFQRCIAAWVASVTGAPTGVIAIDGKTSRRSYQKKNAKVPIHMVSAFLKPDLPFSPQLSAWQV
jgi:hypothetical protein